MFEFCTSLKSITIGNSVTRIQNHAFSGCVSLTDITIPNSVTSIGNYTFYDCSALTDITIPDRVTNIGIKAFGNCSRLTSITIPNNVTTIGYDAFKGCTGVKKLIIEEGNNTLTLGYDGSDKGLFSDCRLETLYLERDFSYKTDSYYIYSPFYSIKTLKRLSIGNSVTSIVNEEFSGCSKLETIYIGKSIETIGDKAFSECDNITEIKVAMENPIAAKLNIFNDCVYDNATLYVPKGTKSLYKSIRPWNVFLNIQEMDFTGIEDVKYEDAKVKGVYDLHGKKVENPINGIYIINGKKTLIK